MNTFTLSAPLRVYGRGKYILSSVMEINGTKKYLTSAEKKRECQNKESQETCLARQYLASGIEKCSCVPYKLRNYSKQVT